VAERFVVPKKLGNAGGGKGPQLEVNAASNEERGIGDEPSNLESGQKLQTTLHAKA